MRHAINKQGDDYTILYRTSFEVQLHEAELHAEEGKSSEPKSILHTPKMMINMLPALTRALPEGSRVT